MGWAAVFGGVDRWSGFFQAAFCMRSLANFAFARPIYLVRPTGTGLWRLSLSAKETIRQLCSLRVLSYAALWVMV